MSSIQRRHPAFFYLLAAPTVLVIAYLTVYPTLAVFSNSLFEYDYIAGTRLFTGLDNYRSILADSQFRQSVINTTLFVALAASLETALGFLLALLYYQPFKGRRTLATITVVPMMLSTMVVSATWRTLYHFDIGPLNALLEVVGAAPVGWLINPDIALFSVVIADVWQWTPFAFVILQAALQTIPREYLEAARIDGAGSGGVVVHVILPLMRPHLLMVALLRTIDTFRLFAKVFALTGGGPGNSTETISYYIYREAYRYFNLGRAGAASVLAFVIIALVASVYIPRLLREEGV